MKANLTELEILRKKRVANQQAEQQRLEEINRAAEKLRQEEEELKAAAVSTENSAADKAPLPAEQPAAPEREDDGLSPELAFLRSRRLNQASPEELKARLQDVVLEKRPELKSGAKSLVTRRPRRKEELPPSKYDFPILYPVDEDEKKTEKTSAMQEVAKVAGQMTDCVKKVFQKVIPRPRVRVKRQRQKQRS